MLEDQITGTFGDYVLCSIWNAERDRLIVRTQTAFIDTVPFWLTVITASQFVHLYDCTLEIQTPCDCNVHYQLMWCPWGERRADVLF